MSGMFGFYAAVVILTSPVMTVGASKSEPEPMALEESAAVPESVSFDVSRFVLPEDADMLVVVEGIGGSGCRVYAYDKEPDGWKNHVETSGYLGKNGMSNHRTEGDKTTPIGVFQMNTPFGQAKRLEGFPENYIQVDESYVWVDDTNRLSRDLSKDGERVGSVGYAGYYDYVLDAGYNKNAIKKKGAALFLHCEGSFKDYSSGCVAIPREQMIRIMQLYGAYGEGHCYIAQAPKGTFEQIYDSYGTNEGLSPGGEFD